MEITIGDSYHIEMGTDVFDIEITKLSTKNVTFMAAGKRVKVPETPRVLPIDVFANWITGLQEQAQKQ